MAKGKYNTHVLPKLVLIEAWCRDGATDETIYTKLGISKDRFYDYKKKHPDFSDTLKKGKEVVDIEVENSLLKRARGYNYEEVTKEIRDGELIVTKRVTKEVQPDVTAQIYWLNNRKPKDWRNKIDTEKTLVVKTYEQALREVKEQIKLEKEGKQ